MPFLIVITCCMAGLWIGAGFGNGGMAGFGFCVGFAIGFLLVWLRSLSARVAALTARLDEFARAPQPGAAAASRPASAAQPAAEIRVSAAPLRIDAARVESTAADAPIAIGPAVPPPPVPPPVRIPSPRESLPPDPLTRALGWVKRWFSEGNVPVKVGMLVLLAGFGALLKYASEQS